jgi:hypothetical protein
MSVAWVRIDGVGTVTATEIKKNLAAIKRLRKRCRELLRRCQELEKLVADHGLKGD